ncbi:MAG TPA: hypothetical protein VF139_09710 [Candidatus Polarisedimenticolaceae bacterium]
MHPSGRPRLLGILLILTLLAGGLPTVVPAVCEDDCADSCGDGCFDCACCAPTRAPAVLGAPAAPVAETAARHEAEATPRTAHADPGDVFHVPRPAA